MDMVISLLEKEKLLCEETIKYLIGRIKRRNTPTKKYGAPLGDNENNEKQLRNYNIKLKQLKKAIEILKGVKEMKLIDVYNNLIIK